MRLKLFSLFAFALILTGCETPPTSDARVATDGSYIDDGSSYQDSGLGSEFSGMGEDELAPGVFNTVYFATDSSVLNSEAQAVLGAQASWLKDNPILNVVVEGHCDERATREYNLALGERRANSIKKFLVSSGVESSRITTISYGKERPAVAGSDAESWALNRRGITVIR